MGGSRLRKELEAFGCSVDETARRHHRICVVRRPAEIEGHSAGLATAIAEGGMQMAPRLGLWSQPGVFSWDRIDPGPAQLMAAKAKLSGRGADFGCGVGVLAKGLLEMSAIASLALIDIDARAIAAARRNIDDPRGSASCSTTCAPPRRGI